MRSFITCLLLCCALPAVALADSININTADAPALDRALNAQDIDGPHRSGHKDSNDETNWNDQWIGD